MDYIYIKDLIILAHIGVFAEEQQQAQRLVLDVHCWVDIKKAAETDNIDDALDYAAIRLFVIEFIESSQYCLLEAMAEALSQKLLDHFSIKKIKLSIAKLDIFSDVGRVGVCVERELS